MNKTSKLLILAVAVSLTLSACGEKKSAATANSENALKVNGQSITVAELDVKTGNAVGEKKHAISEAMLKSIINMELLHQAAVQSKLDADENIRARIASATRSILATAYLEKQLAAIGKPTESEIGAYYSQHPERFAERKQYDFTEFSIQPPPGKEAEIQAQLGKIKQFQEFDQWLTANKIPHSSTPVSVTGDRLPDEVLQKLKNVSVGGAAVMGGKDQMNVIFVVAEQMQPIPLDKAKSLIMNMIVDKQKSDAIEGMVKQLRDKAKIEFVPPYTEHGRPASADGQ